jgi:hypothetical protein
MWKRKPNRQWSVGMKTQDGSTITAIKRPPLVSREEGGAYHKGWWGGVVSTNPLWYDIQQVGITYNKGGYQYITEMDLKSLGR